MRRGLGRGRTLIAVGAILVILSMPFAWLKVGGVVLSSETADGFQGAGVLAFLACVVMLALIVLPYTTRSRRSALDRPLAYLACWLVMAAALAIQVVRIVNTEGSGVTPAEAPGLWIAVSGGALVTWGLLELFAEGQTVS